MKSEQASRESQRVRELADEYKKKGYSVVHPRSQLDLPEFLRGVGYIPDLLATSDEEKLVIEVKTSQTVRHDKDMSQVSELVNRQPGWQFLFVLTNPKSEAPVTAAPSRERWQELLETSRHPSLRNPDLSEAAFILAWAALEGFIREATSADKSSADGRSAIPKAPMSQIRDAAILGLIDRKDLAKLEWMLKIRNGIVHSVGGPKPSLDEVRQLQELVDEVIRAARSSHEEEITLRLSGLEDKLIHMDAGNIFDEDFPASIDQLEEMIEWFITLYGPQLSRQMIRERESLAGLRSRFKRVAERFRQNMLKEDV